MRPLVALLLLVTVTAAAPVPKAMKKKTDDKAAIVGVWMAADNTRNENFEFTEDGKMRAWTGKGPPGNTTFSYTWTIDPTTDPKVMNWGGAGQPTQVQFECVYELDGDRLKVAYNVVGKRPANPTAAGNGNFICDLVRDTTSK